MGRTEVNVIERIWFTLQQYQIVLRQGVSVGSRLNGRTEYPASCSSGMDLPFPMVERNLSTFYRNVEDNLPQRTVERALPYGMVANSVPCTEWSISLTERSN